MWMKVLRNRCLFFYVANSFFHQGGNAVWGNITHAPDDEADANHTHGQLISFRNGGTNTTQLENMTADEASNWILEHTPSTFQVGSKFPFFQVQSSLSTS